MLSCRRRHLFVDLLDGGAITERPYSRPIRNFGLLIDHDASFVLAKRQGSEQLMRPGWNRNDGGAGRYDLGLPDSSIFNNNSVGANCFQPRPEANVDPASGE